MKQNESGEFIKTFQSEVKAITEQSTRRALEAIDTFSGMRNIEVGDFVQNEARVKYNVIFINYLKNRVYLSGKEGSSLEISFENFLQSFVKISTDLPNITKPSCDCGRDIIGAGKHSSWCSKVSDNESL